MQKRFATLNATQAETLAIFAAHHGVSLNELQSLEGRELNATCFELAEKLRKSLSKHFVKENVSDLARGYKALSNGGSI